MIVKLLSDTVTIITIIFCLVGGEVHKEDAALWQLLIELLVIQC